MSINFTGFNNIKIGKKQYEQFGAYCNHNGEILHGKKKYTELKFNTQLTNDPKGNDLDDFLNRTPKKFINEQNPDKLDLRIKRFDIAVEKVRKYTKLLNEAVAKNQDYEEIKKKLKQAFYLYHMT